MSEIEDIRGCVFTRAEEEGLKKAYEIVKKQAKSYQEEGLSPFTFFIGLLNIALIGFLLGRLPEFY